MNMHAPRAGFTNTAETADIASGDQAVIQKTLASMSGNLAASMHIQPGQKVLELAADDSARLWGAGSYDAVSTTLGVMMSDNAEETVAGMARACRPGGKVGFAAWGPVSLANDLFQEAHGADTASLKGLLADDFEDVQIEEKTAIVRHCCPDNEGASFGSDGSHAECTMVACKYFEVVATRR